MIKAALEVATDPDYKYELATRLGKLKMAKARRLDEKESRPANMIYKDNRLNLAALGVGLSSGDDYGVLAREGSIFSGECLFYLGNPVNFVGSHLVGTGAVFNGRGETVGVLVSSFEEGFQIAVHLRAIDTFFILLGAYYFEALALPSCLEHYNGHSRYMLIYETQGVIQLAKKQVLFCKGFT
ncbi:hypothetical protein POM88_038434 [Heracleum sosnowskyi]|uniref:Uncharacterized protein n=1 Tax=Heracleum sosnowskyi TaxID=360622 RepID=A0AAD8HAD3_9APIA|nr:hypothetical protein POM88_038434 [Heracleum sosnowskyi]